MTLTIRPYRDPDAARTRDVFLSAIRTTAAADYTPEQIEAWTGTDTGLRAWAAKRAALNTSVALRNGVVVGFTDVDQSGYIHMLFVDPPHSRKGVATVLLHWAIEEARLLGASRLTTNASITARPFFQSHGFAVEEERYPVVGGVVLQNYRMTRPMGSSSPISDPA